MKIGEKIKIARKKAGLSQAQLAIKSDVAMVTISQYERGVRQPRIEQLRKIAFALGVRLEDLAETETETETFESGAAFDKAWNERAERMRRADQEEQNRLDQLAKDFRKLNVHGQETALERVSEMVQLPQYTEGRAESIAVSYGADGTIKIADQITGETTTMIDGRGARDARGPEANSYDEE